MVEPKKLMLFITWCPDSHELLVQFTLILPLFCKSKSLKTRKNPSEISWTLTQLTRLKQGNEHETCSTFFSFFSFFPEFLFTQVGTKLWKRKENLTRFKKLFLTQFKKPHVSFLLTYVSKYLSTYVLEGFDYILYERKSRDKGVSINLAQWYFRLYYFSPY